MISATVSATVPLLSVLVGAALTYWLNVRTNRRNSVEDVFDKAIAAVAVAEASRHYQPMVVRPDTMPDDQYKDLIATIARTAVETHLQRASEAREALARVLPYEPRVRPFYQGTTLSTLVDATDEIIAILTESRAAHTRMQAIWTRRPAPGG